MQYTERVYITLTRILFRTNNTSIVVSGSILIISLLSRLKADYVLFSTLIIVIMLSNVCTMDVFKVTLSHRNNVNYCIGG